MGSARGQAGTSFVEVLISLAVFSLAVGAVAGLLVDNSRLNTSERMRAEVQANARNCASLIAQRLRSAGWDPLSLGFTAVELDSDPNDDVSYVEVFADLDGDGDLDDEGESVRIQHEGDRIEWRTSSGGGLVPLAAGISNDADGNGTAEPLFVVDSASPPSWIRIRVTAESISNDPRTGEPCRYTVETEVALRGNL